jgi:thiamine-monophosphate kinase
LCITAFGSVPKGRMVRRGGARSGDRLYVTGTIGDSALGLKLHCGDADAMGWPLDEAGRAALIGRYLRPQPRLGLRDALLAHASAAMDISDGLVIDCARMCRAAGVGGRIEAQRVPLSSAVAPLAAAPDLLARALTGGDDYEILAAIPPGEAAAFETAARSAGLPVAFIGMVGEAGGELAVVGADGNPLSFATPGYDHISASSGDSP